MKSAFDTLPCYVYGRFTASLISCLYWLGVLMVDGAAGACKMDVDEEYFRTCT